MGVFSFRAECGVDVERFEQRCFIDGVPIYSILTKKRGGAPDVFVEIDSSSPIEAIWSAMSRVEDGHIMLRTLGEMPLSENPFNGEIIHCQELISSDPIPDFRLLMKLARELGRAERSGDLAQMEKARDEHDAYRNLCLSAKGMTTGLNVGELDHPSPIGG